jgi:phosphoglycerate kinase
MPKKNIQTVDVSGKRVFIRVDFNVPVDFDGGSAKITDDRRIAAALPTIKSVISRGGKAILASHMGRPEGKGYEQDASLKICAERLATLLGKPVLFPSIDCTDDKAAAGVAAMKNGDVLLLENLRFNKGEKKGDATFAARLASYADVYCNDAFGTCHRPDASMVAVPRAMGSKPKVVGFLVEKEIKFLSEALARPAKPFVVVLGGAKVSDKLPAIETLLPKADTILVGGAMAYTFLKALGKPVGSSRVEAEMLKEAHKIIELAARLKAELVLPIDHVCSTQFAEKTGEVHVFSDDDTGIKDGYMGLDIGPATQTKFALIIERAKTVVWNGPMGVFEWPAFAVGTQQIAKAMAEATKKGATTIVGGGDSAAAVEQFKLADKMSHVSTGGGASLEMLEGKKFESVEVLDEA